LQQVRLGNFIIRPAYESEFQAIRELIHTVQINPTGLSWRRFLVATTTSGEFVGCGQVKPHRDGSREVASIAVRPQFRGQGAARAILEALLAREKRRPLYLMCRSQLEPLYQKFGFRAISVDEMTPYFARIYRLFRLFMARRSAEERLSIMRLD
jgi:N-acetylglutamate synthase-like GNAT family acetyltransferase